MPARPLFWLTVFFMLGILADRLFGEGLPVRTHYFAFAALILIAAMAATLWFRSRTEGRKSEAVHPLTHSPTYGAALGNQVVRIHQTVRATHLFTNFAIPALLFVIFGMWASKAAAPQFPQALEQYLNGKPATFIAEVTGSPEYIRQQAVPKIAGEVSASPEGTTRRKGSKRVEEASASPEYSPDKIQIQLRLLSSITGDRQTPLEGGVQLSFPRKDPDNPVVFFLPGDRVLFRSVLKRFHSFRNPGGFDYVLYQAGKGLYAHCFLKDERLLIKLAPGSGTRHSGGAFEPESRMLNAIRGRIETFRQKTLLWAQRSLDPEPAAFYAAMILGYKMLLDRNWQDHIHQTGLNHLLSVSGLHIGMVAMFVFWLVRLAVRFLYPSVLNRVSDKQIAVWPALASAVFYAFLAGFGAPTIWRSILTLAVFFGASFWYRAADSLTVLALAALVILIPAPNNLWLIPFQLTFACVLAIIVIYPRLRGIRLYKVFPALEPDRLAGRIISPFEDAFWVSIAVNILLLPLIIFYFDGFALTGFIANIFLIPYLGFVVLPLGLLSVLLFAISQTLAYPVIWIVNYLLWVCLRMIEWFAGFSWSYFWTGSISPAWLLVFYASMGLLLAPFSRKIKIAGLSGMAVLICAGLVLSSYAGSNNTGTLRVDVIDVGQGTSTLVRLPTGETMLDDGGGIPDDSYDTGRSVVAPYLWHEGIRRLDYVVLSHYHPDHALGLRFILRNFDVGSFWTSEITGDDPAAGEIRRYLDEIASKRKIKIRTFPELLADLQIGQTRIRLLHPNLRAIKDLQGNLNETSLVLDITQGISLVAMCLIIL